MGVFRRYLHSYYARRLKLPPSTGSVPDVSFVGISRIHPRNNLILRDGTFRKVDWRYYTIDRALSPSIFVPGIFSAIHPRLRASWVRGVEFRYYRVKRALPPVTPSAPDVSSAVVSKVHPSRNRRLRDATFRSASLSVYQPKRVLPPSLFVPGVFSPKHPRLRNNWLRGTEFRYYRVKRVLPPVTPAAADVGGIAVSKVHPSRNRRLRDETFRLPSLAVYQPKRVLPPSLFVPGIFSAIHPGLRNNWDRSVEFRYYRVRRALPPVTPSAPDVSGVVVSKVHPGRNRRLRDATFRPASLAVYQPKRVLPPVPAVVVSFIAVSKVHPSRNRRLRDATFRPDSLAVYQPKRVMYPNLFVAGILILVSKVHPSRNRRLRDATFRPPSLHYYQPAREVSLSVGIVATGLTEVLFKGMWRGMFRSMR